MAEPSRIQSVDKEYLVQMAKFVHDSQDPMKRPPVPPDYRSKELCRVRPSGCSNTGWISYTISRAEEKLATDCPDWDKTLMVCPPGTLYVDKMEKYDIARDLAFKNDNALTSDWRDKNEVGHYTGRIGAMGETVVKLAVEREVRGGPGLLLCGFKLMYLALASNNLVPFVKALVIDCERQFTPRRILKKKTGIITIFTDHYSLEVKIEGLTKREKVTEKEITWNTSKPGAWEVYERLTKEEAAKVKELAEDDKLDSNMTMKKIEVIEKSITFKAFGKTKQPSNSHEHLLHLKHSVLYYTSQRNPLSQMR